MIALYVCIAPYEELKEDMGIFLCSLYVLATKCAILMQTHEPIKMASKYGFETDDRN
jgi:hypothetical protein